jgi:hypothetical protein
LLSLSFFLLLLAFFVTVLLTGKKRGATKVVVHKHSRSPSKTENKKKQEGAKCAVVEN